MTKLATSLVLLIACLGCTKTPAPIPQTGPQSHAQDTPPSESLPGEYVGWMFIDGEFMLLDGSGGTKDTIKLNSDGTFERLAETTIMQTTQVKSTGRYLRSGDKVDLIGTSEAKVQIEAAPEIRAFPLEMQLVIAQDSLRDQKKGVIAGMFYRKVGTGPPIVPEDLKLKPSDPKALKLVDEIKTTYAGLNSFSCTGTLKAEGGGFLALSAKYEYTFLRPKLRYTASTPRLTEDIYWDGKKTWWTTGGKSVEGRPLNDALSTVGGQMGPGGELLTSLLLPDSQMTPMLDASEVSLAPVETINGSKCWVLKLTTANLDSTRIWIDQANHMILKLTEDLRAGTVEFSPKPDSAINTTRFQPPK